ncbi:MAG: hypothetical protein VXA34_00165 [Gammaproteobacteria bacterium]
MSKILVDEIAPKTSGSKVLMPQGGVIQIQYDQLTTADVVTMTASTYTKLTTLPNVTITPVSTSSKMKIDVMWNGEFGSMDSAYNGVWCLYRNNTLIKGNTDTGGYLTMGMAASSISYWVQEASSTPENASYTYFDEPSTTSAITYYIGFYTTQGGGLYTNRTVTDSTGDGYERMITNMTVTEIAG